MSLPATAWEIRTAVAAGAVSAVEICRATLERCTARNPALNAFLSIDTEGALTRAAAIDALPRTDRDASPLAGVPVAVKDNISTRGLRTTAGSRMLASYVPPYDATVVERLQEAGAVLVGKTNCDEFAMGSSNETSAFGPVVNPWRPGVTPGGSSGGSAAAVAARLAPVALGSDTGGSVRQPAALCGVVGLKPTYGRVSRYGLIAFGSSLDQIGPLTLTVRDAALVLGAIAGLDPRDATSSQAPVADWIAAVDRPPRPFRIGVPRHLLEDGVDAGVRASFEQALGVLVEAGGTVVPVTLEHAALAIPVYYLVATAEASSNLARYDGVRYGHRTAAPSDLESLYRRSRSEGFGTEVKRRIILGTYVLSHGYYDAYYLKAQQVRTLIQRDYAAALAGVDVIATPTSPTPAFALGSKLDDPMQMYLADVFTVSANLTGLPAVSLPAGRADGLPVGLQLTGRAFDEAMVLGVGSAFEARTSWHAEPPPLA